jgi:2-polyprenyl-3-methyl-5-hydroxy-6-metoxy-1,4-benzoquinol methylase
VKVKCDMQENNLTTTEYWESAGAKPPRMQLPSSWNVSILNTKKFLKSYIKSGIQVLQIGCAPGKMLAYCAAKLQAEVAGIDYSKPGMLYAEKLFETLGIKGDLRCEDVFSHSLQNSTFDLVYSLRVIEHFVDPRPVVEIHKQLLKPGGVALIVIPNYG